MDQTQFGKIVLSDDSVRTTEPIRFKCDECGEVSNGKLDFEYWDTIKWVKGWMIIEHHEGSSAFANCEKCNANVYVWPEHNVELEWKRR